MGYWTNKIKEITKHHLMLLYASYALNKIGLHITPFYLTQEFSQIKPPVLKLNNIDNVQYTMLTSQDIEKLFTNPEFKYSIRDRKTFIDDNCLCYALVQDDEIMSVMWCNLKEINNLLLTIPLKQDEAYLCGMKTHTKYKGLSLAPYLRYKVYQSLSEMGRLKLYSLTEYLNKSSKRFKEKLEARHIMLYIHVQLSHVFDKRFALKKYDITNSEL
jgi:hypothetical protein